MAKLVLCLASQAASPLDAPIFVSLGAEAGAGPVIGAVWLPAFAGGVTLYVMLGPISGGAIWQGL